MSWSMGGIVKSLLLVVLATIGIRWIRSHGEVWHSLPDEVASGDEGP